MKTKYQLMVMSFDGEYKREGSFDTIEEAWEYSNNIGSRWYFYPFHFVVTEKTVAESFEFMGLSGFLNGKHIKTVSRFFESLSKKPEAQGLDVDGFCYLMADNV